MLLDHVSCGGTRRNELRGDQRGERQQELLQGKLKGTGSVAIVLWLWTRHIQQDINAARLLRHPIQVGLHGLLIQSIDLGGVGDATRLLNLGGELLDRREPATREKDRRPLGRKLFGDPCSNFATCAKDDGVLVL